MVSFVLSLVLSFITSTRCSQIRGIKRINTRADKYKALQRKIAKFFGETKSKSKILLDTKKPRLVLLQARLWKIRPWEIVIIHYGSLKSERIDEKWRRTTAHENTRWWNWRRYRSKKNQKRENTAQVGGKGTQRAFVVVALPESDLFYFVFPEIPRDSSDSHRAIPSPKEARVMLSGRPLRGGDDAKKEGIMM